MAQAIGDGYFEQLFNEKQTEKRKWLDAYSILKTALDLKELSVTDPKYCSTDSDVGKTELAVVLPSLSLSLALPTHLLCTGSPSGKLFKPIVLERLEEYDGSKIQIVGFRSYTSFPMIRLKIHQCLFVLVYNREVDSSFNKISPSPLQTTFYLEQFLSTIDQPEEFGRFHNVIRHWAINRGLFSKSGGFINDLHIALLMVPVYQSLYEPQNEADDTHFFALKFMDFYDYFHFEQKVICGTTVQDQSPEYKRGPSDKLVLINPSSLRANTASAVDEHTLHFLKTEFNRAKRSIESSQFINYLSSSKDSADPPWAASGLPEFFEGPYSWFIQVDVRYWGKSRKGWAELVAAVESDLLSILQDVRAKFPVYEVRLWPEWLVQRSAEYENHRSESLLKFIRIKIENPLVPALEKIYSDLSTKYSGTRTGLLGERIDESYIDLKLLRRKDIQDMVPFENTPFAVEIDEATEALKDDEDTGGSSKSKKGSVGKPQAQAKGSDEESAGVKFRAVIESSRKLRPASDVLNRLRWDPQHDIENYVIGYLDRFDGIQELAASQWADESTDEEFIPQHRIVYFKRIEDQEIVWDRKQHVDKVFST